MRGLGSGKPYVRFAQRRSDAGQRAFGLGAYGLLALGGVLRGALRPLARVERVIEREPIVALDDGVVGQLERFARGIEVVGRISIRAGGFRGVDCGLRLLHFLVRRPGARRNQRREQGKRREEPARGHPSKYTCGCSTMKELSLDDRPREKLLRHGAASLGDNELVALVLGHGTAGANALSVANALLAVSGGAHGLTRLSRSQLALVPGVGAALACRVQAAVELGRRTLVVMPPVRQQFIAPREVAEFLLPRFGAYPVERFGVMMLDTKRRLIRVQLISIGTLDATHAHPRDVFREATIAGAAAIVAFHNHPSGDVQPSRDDIALTRRLAAAGSIMGIDLDDHMILADTRYFSMRQAEVLAWRG